MSLRARNLREETYVRLEQQGDLIAIAFERPSAPGSTTGGTRGNVKEFSAASRRRLMQKFARLAPSRATFVTLTYPATYPEVRRAKEHLRAFLERIRRLHPESSAIWRLEFQARGAPHFHIVFYNLPYLPFHVLRKMWREVIGHSETEALFVNIKLCTSKREIANYVSKYVAKVSSLFNKDAYPHVGRWWGVFNKDALPLSAQYEVLVRVTGDPRAIYDIKKMFRRRWLGYNRTRRTGGVLLSDRASPLLKAALRMLEQADNIETLI